MNEEIIDELVKKHFGPEMFHFAPSKYQEFARAVEEMVVSGGKPVPAAWRSHNRIANIPHHMDSDMRVIGFVVPVSTKWPMACIQEQLAEIIEPPAPKCDECSNTGYVPDGNHCLACSVPADPNIEELFERQQAGFERCYEALGITDDRERSWSSLVMAILEAAQERGHDFKFEGWFDKEYPQNSEGRRPRYSETSVMDLLRASFEAGRDHKAKPVLQTGDLLEEKLEFMRQEHYKAVDEAFTHRLAEEPIAWIDDYALRCLKGNATATCAPKGMREENQDIPLFAQSLTLTKNQRTALESAIRILSNGGYNSTFAEYLKPLLELKTGDLLEEKPIATLHDDGHFTWHGEKPQGYNYAGWRMKVSAAPQANHDSTDCEGIVPLTEPVSIAKALLAGEEAKVVKAAGAVVAAFLVNIQLTPWNNSKDRAEGYVKGFNYAAKLMQEALMKISGIAVSEDVIDHCWKMYQQGQGAMDYTDKEVFAQTLQSFAKWISVNTPVRVGEKIYQCRENIHADNDIWSDCSKDAHDHMAKYPACFATRTVYMEKK